VATEEGNHGPGGPDRATTHGSDRAGDCKSPLRYPSVQGHETDQKRIPYTMTVVDWTEARASDWRFDLAWALALLTIYYPEGSADAFLDVYRSHARRPDSDELDAFVAIVGLHWMQLARTAPVPINDEWWERAERLVRQRLQRLPGPRASLARLESRRSPPPRPQR